MNKTALIASLLGLASLSVVAEEPKRPWKNVTDVSVVSTNGNSRTTTTSAKETLTYENANIKAELFGSGLGSSSRGQVTAEEYAAGEKLDYKFTPRDYVYEKFKWDKNRFAGIRNRYDAGVGYGRKVLDLPKDKLDSELGGGYINEERANAPRNDFASGRAYSKYRHLFTEKNYFSQDIEYLHNFEDADGYRLNTETALVGSLTDIVSMKAAYVWNRLGKPAEGFAKDDTKVTVGLLISY